MVGCKSFGVVTYYFIITMVVLNAFFYTGLPECINLFLFALMCNIMHIDKRGWEVQYYVMVDCDLDVLFFSEHSASVQEQGIAEVVPEYHSRSEARVHAL